MSGRADVSGRGKAGSAGSAAMAGAAAASAAPAAPGWRPAPVPLMTRWAAEVDPASPLPEHPRPRLEREEWLSLNGLWDYAVRPAAAGRPSAWDGRILVPFPLESSLSGVGRRLGPDEALWYRRQLAAPPAWAGRRVLLNFGAVDHSCELFLDGRPAGGHRGGYDPFSFDVTEVLADGGPHELVLAVLDPGDSGEQARGKQSLRPGGIMYGAVSGIWQGVWLEAAPERRALGLVALPRPAEGKLRLELAANGATGYRVRVLAEGQSIAEGRGAAGLPLELDLRAARPWSPADPFLHRLEVETDSGDRFSSYFGHREFRLGEDGAGRRRLFLNGEPLFLNAVLDQGYFPEGLYTAPTDAALAFDLEAARRLGFNAVRKHAKIECARWYYHAARLGLLVWQDLPSGGRRRDPFLLGAANLLGLRLRDRGPFARAALGRSDPGGRARCLEELSRAAAYLRGETAVAAWTLFNEGWGQFDAAGAEAVFRAAEPDLPVDQASGWFDQGGGDFDSRHVYFGPFPSPGAELAKAARRPGAAPRAFALSEYGGLTLSVEGHRWAPRREFGYRRFGDAASLSAAYEKLVGEGVAPLAPEGLAAAVYTQITDVEEETNGLLTYDREVWKVDEARAAAINGRLSGF